MQIRNIGRDHRATRMYGWQGTRSETLSDPFSVDRVRLLFSPEFHRLSAVTQIFKAGESDRVHNRLVHSLKVAEVGRALAERCSSKNAKLAGAIDLSSNVVEAASLAHDLGHPPFGHAGETELKRILIEAGDEDGFEGNAQTFRIVTRLALGVYTDVCGLNLSRATLNAVLKYPWVRDKNDKNKRNKWSVYSCDIDAFRFARENFDSEKRSIECQIMDWADDIAYVVHDIEDLCKAGLSPWQAINSREGRAEFVNHILDEEPEKTRSQVERATNVVAELSELWDLPARTFRGMTSDVIQIRQLSSMLQNYFIEGTSLVSDKKGYATLNIEKNCAQTMFVLKKINMMAILNSVQLRQQQFVYKRIIKHLFEVFANEMGHNLHNTLIPVSLFRFRDASSSDLRFVSDCIATLTDREAISLYENFTGTSCEVLRRTLVS